MNPHVRAAGIANARADVIVLDAVFCHQTDARANTVAVALRSDCPDEQPVVGGWADIPQDSQWPIELRQNHVDAAIVVQVSKGRAAVHASLGKHHSSRGGDLGEIEVAEIRKDDVGLRYGGTQTAFSVHHVAAGGEEVLVAVVIEVVNSVAPSGFRPRSARHTARECDLLKTHLT